MIISVASGKGGTGKTTIATNLAIAHQGKVVLMDCDVEEPNAHLFVHPRIHRIETVTTPVPEVDMQKCSLCGKCSEICQFNAIAVLGETVLPFPELCHGCGGCMLVCPEKAITESGRELGVIEHGTRNGLTFIHGKLRIGEAMAPPLIRKVRENTQPDILTIIDAPPGTSCPVIASMRGADFVLLVTEPTPFGLHDLKLAIGAVNLLGIACGLVINRSDIGDDRVREYAEAEEIPILMEIPFNREIAEVYSRGDLLVEAIDGWNRRFQDLYCRIEKIVHSQNAPDAQTRLIYQ